ncbi:MAG: Crp/Fnr family transcriptional regulator [Chloroflexi bacterium]|nr:Crp/Fnr family transcriptional regulator [Chloroflexota bacterium]
MFARVSGTGKYRYLQLVENHRDAHRTVQRVVCTLGRVEQLKASGRIDVLVRSLARFGRQAELGDNRKAGRPERVTAPTLEPLAKFGRDRQPPPGDTGFLPPVNRTGSEEASFNDTSVEIAEFSQRAAGILRKNPIFSDLSKQHIAELSHLALDRRLEAGQFLYLQGDAVECCYLIVSGMAKLLKHSLSGKDLITGIYGPGEVLGIIAFFLGHPYSASVQAVTETRVLGIKRGDFASFFDRYPELSVKIAGRMLEVMTRRHHAAIVRLGDLAVERISYRLARVLFALFLELGPIIPLTRQEISQMAGTTTETVSRFVSRLRQEGIVDSFRGRLILLEQDKLRLLAQVHSLA